MCDFSGVYLLKFHEILYPYAFFWAMSKKRTGGWVGGWMGGWVGVRTLIIKLTSAQLRFATLQMGLWLSLAINCTITKCSLFYQFCTLHMLDAMLLLDYCVIVQIE